jgi:hypothetical protein
VVGGVWEVLLCFQLQRFVNIRCEGSRKDAERRGALDGSRQQRTYRASREQRTAARGVGGSVQSSKVTAAHIS